MKNLRRRTSKLRRRKFEIRRRGQNSRRRGFLVRLGLFEAVSESDPVLSSSIRGLGTRAVWFESDQGPDLETLKM